MLPEGGCVSWLRWSMVKSPDRKGDDHGSAATREVGPGRQGRAGTPLPDHPRRHHPHPLRKLSTFVRQVGHGFVESAASLIGLLIQAAVGSSGGVGGLRTNRSGWAA